MRQNFKVNKDKKRFEDGVTIVFENGASISIQSSPTHNCTAGQNVEIHAWGPKQERIPLKGGNDCVGWVRMDELPDFMQTVKNWNRADQEKAASDKLMVTAEALLTGREG